MNTKRRGFTLIELLVVVAIIALLISILLPSLAGARDQSKSIVCLSNLRRLGVSTVLYLHDNRGLFYPLRLHTTLVNGTPQTYVNEYGAQEPRWHWFIPTGAGPVIDPAPFAGLPGGQFNDESLDGLGTQMTNNYFLDPSLTDRRYARHIADGAYGFNYQYLGNSRTDEPLAPGSEYDNFPVRESAINAPSATVLIGDSRGAGLRHGFHSYTLDPPRLATEAFAADYGPDEDDPPPAEGPQFMMSPVEMRHRGRGNIVFVDGHAEALRLKQLGYQLDANGNVVPNGVPGFPLGSVASNKLWTGHNRDPIHEQLVSP
ncbi:MAG TPA: prepilin-type N-terminal cleavage/methylation domain-containing protein [Phycisphaerae bacterium]|jgi:prepilin-type N-terminal cleavage/methylation domain-containing protein/prepilin-type processing-associated H-X9-DG protein